MLRFTAAAFLILCCTVYTASAAGMDDVIFQKSIQEITEQAKKSWKVKDALSQAAKLKEGSQGNATRLEQLKTVVTPILNNQIISLKSTLSTERESGFKSVISSASLIKSTIDTFYEGTEAAALKESLAGEIEKILPERIKNIYCPEFDPLPKAVTEALVVKKQISPFATGVHPFQDVLMDSFKSLIQKAIGSLKRFDSFQEKLAKALAFKDEVKKLEEGTGDTILQDEVVKGLVPLLTSEIGKAQTSSQKEKILLELKTGVQHLQEGVTTTVLQDTWTNQIETFLGQKVAIIKWHKNRDAELAELRELAGKLELGSTGFKTYLGRDGIFTITDEELTSKIEAIKQERSHQQAYVMAIEAYQSLDGNVPQRDQLKNAVETILRSGMDKQSHIKDIDSALQTRNVIDTLYEGQKKTELEDALAAAFKPFVKEGLIFGRNESFNAKLDMTLKLKNKVEFLEGNAHPTALRMAVLDAFKSSVEAAIGSAQSLEDMLAIKDKVKQIEDGLSTTALQDFIAQKFEDRLLRAIRALENRDLSEAKKGMLELKAAIPSIQAGCSDAATKALQDVWDEATTPLKVSRRPVHYQTWGEKPFDNVSTLFNRSAKKLTGFRDEENWNDPKFQGNPVRAAVMSILWYERETKRPLLPEDPPEWDRYVSEVTKMATKAGKTDFAETYPNRSSKILAILALLNPPVDDGETRSFVLKSSLQILSTGGPWGFNYEKKTPKEELLALYQAAWNTGIRQSDTPNPLEDLAKNLIKKADTNRPGYDEQRLINHQAIAFTIAAKASATVNADVTDDQIMDALNGQLAKVWSGKTVTKQALAKKLEALEERMQ